VPQPALRRTRAGRHRTAHGRYRLPALSVLAVAAAAGVGGLPGPRALPLLGALPLLTVVNVILRQRSRPTRARGIARRRLPK
jgi:hypothetical protein